MHQQCGPLTQQHILLSLKRCSAGQPAGLLVTTTHMLQDLNWRTLEQWRIDSRLTLMYKITYDLVAIPAADYLIPNSRQSRHNHLVAYRQIPHSKTITTTHSFPAPLSTGMPTHFISLSYLLWHDSVIVCAN